MYGGTDGLTQTYSGYSTWNGTNWVNTPPFGGMAERTFHCMAYHAATSRCVAFSGYQSPSGFLDTGLTLTFNSTTWNEQFPVPRPPARPKAAMAYDTLRARAVLFGGGDGTTDLADTWEWSGTSWSQVQISGPSPRHGHAMVYDSNRHVIVLFGGEHTGSYLSETWELVPSCYANCDASTTPPVLNVNDFTCFLNRFAAGDTAANCDGSTTQPLLNVNDFTCFLNRFAAGCP
jgi:hypothetical protein